MLIKFVVACRMDSMCNDSMCNDYKGGMKERRGGRRLLCVEEELLVARRSTNILLIHKRFNFFFIVYITSIYVRNYEYFNNLNFIIIIKYPCFET